MMATFLFEVGSALYVLWRYRLNPVSRRAIAMLLLLATFQLAEYNVCETALGLDSVTWSRLGFVAITFLPPVGIDLAMTMARRRSLPLLAMVYGLAIGFGGMFLFAGQGFNGHVCNGNYVIFHILPGMVNFYAFYYYGLLMLGVALCLQYASKIAERRIKIALLWLVAGYMAFMIPTTTVNVIDPSTIAGIPSIMCGFAVILALVTVGKVLPNYYSKK
jgi:hypothetical protein